jgi:hypothetical protein
MAGESELASPASSSVLESDAPPSGVGAGTQAPSMHPSVHRGASGAFAASVNQRTYPRRNTWARRVAHERNSRATGGSAK